MWRIFMAFLVYGRCRSSLTGGKADGVARLRQLEQLGRRVLVGGQAA
jgi:hypothetical protein